MRKFFHLKGAGTGAATDDSPGERSEEARPDTQETTQTNLLKGGQVPMLFYDFYVFYSAAALLHLGQNPYDYNAYQEALWAIGFPPSKIIYPFPYPPWALPFIWPLGALPFYQALLAVSVIGITAVLLVTEKVVLHLPLPRWLTRTELFFFTVSFWPFLKTVLFGQLSWIFFIGLGLGTILLEKRKTFWAGATLTLLSFKVHLAVLPIAMFLGHALRARDARFVLGLTAGATILFLTSCNFLDGGLNAYHDLLSVSPHRDSSSPIITASIASWLSPYISQYAATMGALLASAFIGLYFGLKLDPTVGNTFLVAAPVTLLLTPYAWSHDYLILLPAVLVAFSHIFKTHERTALYTWTTVMILVAFVTTIAEWSFPLFLIPLLVAAWKIFQFHRSPALLRILRPTS